MAVKVTETQKVLLDLGLGPHGKVTKFVTSTIAKHTDKYVPFRTGALAETVVLNGQPTSNVTDNTITYEQEYASYVYKGITKSGKKMNYRTDKHSNAGPYWVERMMTVDKDKIYREVQKEIDRGA